jgi:Ca-dependent carbohydrate-binding module xylan-binding
MAEDVYQGDAQFTVSVDGKQIGGTQTTTAHLAEGQSQEFDVKGDFGSGSHTVGVTFLNDAIGGFYPAGTPGLPPGQWADDTTDRNLYVMGASLNGGPAASGLPWELSSSGTETFTVTSGSGSSPPSSGAFASDGAASGNNAAITSDSVSAGSSDSGISFITSSTADTTASGSGSTSSTATDGSGTTTTDTTPTLSSTLSDANTTPAAPTATRTTTSTDSTTAGATTASDQIATAGRTAGHWWTNHQHSSAAWSHHQNG